MSPVVGSAEPRVLSPAVRWFAALGFPAALVATLTGAWLLMRSGIPPELSILPFIAGFSLWIAVAERLVPWNQSWLHSRGDLRTDILLYLTNGSVALVFNPLLIAASAHAGAQLSAIVGMGLWPATWPMMAQLALGLVIVELIEYSLHRMMHEVPWMWRLHATHHSAPRLYWLNAARFHPIDLFLVGTGKLVPLALLGAGAPVFALISLFSAVHGAYQHANVPVRIGPLNRIFSMTELHRWHHSPSVRESNHNYGGNLAVWDIVFGTWFLPTDREPPEAIGMETLPRFPTGYWDNLAAPFRWQHVVAESSPDSHR